MRNRPARFDLSHLAIGALLLGLHAPALAQGDRKADLPAMFAAAEKEGRVGVARKTKAVDVRPAKPGEIVVTVIKGEGKETQSPPAAAGDLVVRNRCPETGNEQFLVKAATFTERYEGPTGPADSAGWQPYRPRGIELQYFIVRPTDGNFSFTAPWGEAMVARPNDAIVRNPNDVKDMYRVAAIAFACTYEVVKTPANR